MDSSFNTSVGREQSFSAECSVVSRYFYRVGGCLLIATGLAKVVSAFGTAAILSTGDPVLGIPIRPLFWTIGFIEILVGIYCFFSHGGLLTPLLIAWLSTSFLIYRAGLLLIGYQHPCICLGSVTGAIRLSPHAADLLMKLILAYLTIGSYGHLISIWKNRSELQ